MATVPHGGTVPAKGVRPLPATVMRTARLSRLSADARRAAYGTLLANVPNVPAAVTRATVERMLADGRLAPHHAATLWLAATAYGMP